MKILYVLGSFFPAQNGGPNNTVYWAASEIATQGIDVSVVSLKDGLTSDHIQKYKIKLGGVTHYDGLSVYFFSYIISRYFAFSMYIWLFRNIRTFDGLMLTSVFFPITWYAVILCRIFNVPFSIAPRGELEPGALVFKKRVKIFLLRFFIIRLISRAKYFVVTSEQEKQYTEVFFSDKVAKKLVPNFMAMSDFQLSEVKDQAPMRSGFLYLGRIHPKKGIENLIDAFDILPDDDKILTIAGNGENNYVEHLKASVMSKNLGDRITFAGHVEGDTKADLYKSYKALVLPSFSENFGNVVVEAMSYGLPVIASMNTPWMEIQTEKCGYWIDNSPMSLATTMERLTIMSQSEYRHMSINAHRFARERYDITSKGSLLKRLVLELLS